MIDVKTSSRNHAVDISTLVDKTEFLQDILRLREKWKITKLEPLKGLLPDTTHLLHFESLFKSKFSTAEDAVKNYEEFNKDIELVLKRFKRGKNFREVVLYALFAGVIPEGVYQSCYFDVATLNEKADLSKPEDYQYILVVSPRAEKQEVIDVFNNLKEFIKEKVNFESRKHDNLVINRNLISDNEVQELKEQARLIEDEYIKYKEKTKNASTDEVVDEYSRFSERTQPMRDKYEALRHKMPLSMDNPEDVELINLFHAGPIYESAIIAYGNRLDLERAREWNWMRFGDFINGLRDEPKTLEDVAEEWRRKCPKYPTDNDTKHDENCMYCHVDASNLAHTLSTYKKLLA